MLFVMMINEKNIDKHIDNFMNQFEIADEYKAKIKSYYKMFLEIKNMFVGACKKEDK